MLGQGRPGWVGLVSGALLALVAFVAVGKARADSTSTWPEAMRDDADLRDVHFVDPRFGWAVGDRGVIWHTQDAGTTWRSQRSPVPCRLHAIQFLNRTTGWAVGGWTRIYQHLGQAVVLRTADSGRHWEAVDKALLPDLRQVHFLDDQHGFAFGSQWPLFPSGAFQTDDGGRTWQRLAVPRPDAWTDAAFASRGEKLLVAPTQALAWGPRASSAEVLREVHDGPLRAGGWLGGKGQPTAIVVGDRGTCYGFEQQEWQNWRDRLPAGTAVQFDFRAVATADDHIWIAGAPGTTVLHSPDRGIHWLVQRTQQALPLNGLHFVDSSHGWAVGELGLILHTSDGGLTWQIQRGADRRLTAFGVFARPEDVLLAGVAHLAAVHGYRCRIAVLDANVSSPTGEFHASSRRPYRVSPERRLHEAVVNVGGAGAEVLHEFPLAPVSIGLVPDIQFRTWQVLHRQQRLRYESRTQLDYRFTRDLRMHRPSIVFANLPRDHSEEIILDSMRRAAHLAQDPDAFPDQMAVAGLNPWAIERIAVLSDSSTNKLEGRLNNAELAMALSSSIGGLASSQSGLVQARPESTPVHVSFRYLAGEPTSRGLAGGLKIPFDSPARRAPMESRVAQAADLTRHLQQQQNIENLLGLAGQQTDGSWLGSLQQMSGEFPPEDAGRLRYQVAERLQTFGRWDTVDRTLEALIREFSPQDVAAAAHRDLILIRASAELAIRPIPGRKSEVPRIDSLPGEPGRLRLAAANRFLNESRRLTDVAAAGRRRGSNLTTTQNVATLFEEFDPFVRAEPSLQFARAASERSRNTPLANKRVYERLKKTAPNLSWRRCAIGELALLDPHRHQPKAIAICRRGTRPQLDGILKDSIWQAAEPVSVHRLRPLDVPLTTSLRLARDEQFLYVALTCSRFSGMDYASPLSARHRDQVDQDHDRVELLFDVNRDYTSGWKLAIDARGATSESFRFESHDLDPTWNPTWYVAAVRDEQTWSIETAIRWSDLTAEPADTVDAWILGIRRTVPGQGWQTWPAEAVWGMPWNQLGYLLF